MIEFKATDAWYRKAAENDLYEEKMQLSDFDKLRLSFLPEKDQERVERILEEIRVREMIIEYYLQRETGND